MSRNLLIAALALGSATASAQVVNTQVNGLTLTNGLSSITDSSGLGTHENLNTGIGYLTDNDTSTYAINLGADAEFNYIPSSSLQGNFGGTISSSATDIYIVSLGDSILTRSGSFDVQLVLSAGLSGAISYGSSDFTNTLQEINLISGYSAGSVITYNFALYYSYLPISFNDFFVSPDQVLGIRLSNFNPSWPDISFIGAGYTAPIPEPSTYGLILGGLALAGAAIRRRKSAK